LTFVADVTGTSDNADAVRRFRIYLGAAAGVGKTVAMLDEGRRLRTGGTDVVIGFVESHGRPATEQRIAYLEVVPRNVLDHRGARFEEMDLDAVLKRHPAVALVDELAHTNLPQSGRHEKRWQDVLELLEAGVGVTTTVNIQHLESIAGAVERLTGAPVRELVPDWLVRRADQIELVDCSPEQLRSRLLRGSVYSQEDVSQALTHFFRTDNLIALRELARRFLAGSSEVELLEYLKGQQAQRQREAADRIMVGVSTAPGTDAVIRNASRMAARIEADLYAVHVVSTARRSRHDDLADLRRIVSEVGGSWHELKSDDTAEALTGFARRHHVTQIVLGSSHRSRLEQLASGGSIVRRVTQLAAGAGVDVHIIAGRQVPDS
jgi:two-component system sensor histidine kinase KdpD